MANHDYVLANQSGASFRADLNNLAQAIASLNSGTSDPSATFSVAYMLWADTSTGLLKIRNAANSAWVTLGTLASSYLGLITHSLATAKGDTLAATGSGAFAKLAVGSNAYRPEADSSQASGIKWSSVLPSVQIFSSGSGNYTTPSGVKAIRVSMIGGGGGGGATGSTGSPTGGGNGGSTTFGTSLLTAGGGSGGAVASGGGGGAGGIGGSATLNSPATGVSFAGGAGRNGSNVLAVATGAPGAGTRFSEGGAGGAASNGGGVAVTNSGAGGGGAGGSTGSFSGGGGGGAGAFIEAYITSPSASYPYSVAAAGTAGSIGGGNGAAGGAGAAGLIIVEEFR